MPASAYVQRGLVVQFDAIDNVGTGTHDPAATVWKDLVAANGGAFDMTKTSHGSFSDTALVCDGSGSGAKGVSPTVTMGTLEIFYTLANDLTVNSLLYTSGLKTGDKMDWSIGLLSNDRGFLNGEKMYPIGTDYSGTHAVSWMKASGNCYYDGVQKASSGANFFGATPARQVGTSAVGSFGDTDTPCAVKMHAIRIYNRELDASEVAYNAAIDKIRFAGANLDDVMPDGWKLVNNRPYVRVRVSCTKGYGTVAFAGGEADCDIEKWVEPGDVVTLTLSLVKGCMLSGWTGDAPTAGATAGTYTITADGARSATANILSTDPNVIELVAAARAKNAYRELSASTTADSNHNVSHAFDGSLSGNSYSVWYSKTAADGADLTDQWIQHRFTDAFEPGKYITVLSYRICGPNNGDSVNNRPKTWEFLGSNDGETWEVLDEREYNWEVSDMKFPCQVLKPFRWYRLHMTSVKNATQYKINDLMFYGVVTDSPTPFAGSKIWIGETTGDWSDAASWSSDIPEMSGKVPAAGEKVLIPPGNTVTVAADTEKVGEVILAGTLTMSGWDTQLKADKVTILKEANVTCARCTDPNGEKHRVNIVCDDLIVDAGGSINVKGRGYAVLKGPGAGSNYGAAHGGFGAGIYRRTTAPVNIKVYGDAVRPVEPGSGADDGMGGGVVRIDATGTVTVNGTVTAAGQDCAGYRVYNTGGSNKGGGSGGSVYITCGRFAGTSGTVNAAGGGGRIVLSSSGTYTIGNAICGAGGGGRIAIHQSGGKPAAISGMTFTAAPGEIHGGTYTGPTTYFDSTVTTEDRFFCDAGPGSLWFSDDSFFAGLEDGNGTYCGALSGVTNVTLKAIRMTKGYLRFPNAGGCVTVTGDVSIESKNARLEIGGEIASNRTARAEFYTASPMTLEVGGDLSLTNGGRLDVRAAASGDDPAVGAYVNVAGDIEVGTGSVIYAWSDVETGYSPTFSAANVFVATGGIVTADVRGFGGGWSEHKAGYGSSVTNNKYHPIWPGAGGACRNGVFGGDGGGTVRLSATNEIVVAGTLSAVGEKAGGSGSSGNQDGGSGGTIVLSAPNVTGPEGALLTTKGGDADTMAVATAKAGDGGRIAVWTGLGWYPGVKRSQQTRSEDEPIVSWLGGDVYHGSCCVDGGTSPLAETVPGAVGDVGSVWFVDVTDKWSGLMIKVQ